MDEELRTLITTPFDLGGFDKDVGWCGDVHTLSIEANGRIQVLREANENGVPRGADRFHVALETVDRTAGVLVLRGIERPLELVFGLTSRAAIKSAFYPAGTLTLSEPPAEELYGEVLGAPASVPRVSLASSASGRTAHLFLGTDTPIAQAEITGEPLTSLAVGSRPTRTLELRWSSASPLALHVVREVLPRRTYLAYRRLLTRGLP